MDVFKRLVKGELSLAVTFWDFIILGCILPMVIINQLIGIFEISQTIESQAAVTLVVMIQFIITCMATSGIFFILRNKKITFWGVIAFIISILNLIYFLLIVIISFYEIYFIFIYNYH